MIEKTHTLANCVFSNAKESSPAVSHAGRPLFRRDLILLNSVSSSSLETEQKLGILATTLENITLALDKHVFVFRIYESMDLEGLRRKSK